MTKFVCYYYSIPDDQGTRCVSENIPRIPFGHSRKQFKHV